MNVRRIVTGRAADGSSIVVSDGPAPRTHAFVHIPGLSEVMIWATEAGEPIRSDGADPTPLVATLLPGPGATRLLVLRFPPDSVFADPAFDPVAAAAERRETAPDLADAFEADAPGMHTTDSVDYGIVLDGEVWLELDGGQLTHLTRGDIIVQNGTRHAWRNLGQRPATLAFVIVGARRDALR